MASDNEHVAKLVAARNRQVAARRQVAEALAGDYQRGRTEEMRKMFVEIQATIEALEHAITHEKESWSAMNVGAAGYKIDLGEK